MARRAVPAGSGEAEKADPLIAFLAERLVYLGAGAAFVVGPMCLALSGFGLPGTYGSATAIALAHLAIPFLALGWLNLSRNPWPAGVFALASWSALAGTLIAVSPVIALTSGLVLFMVAGSGGAALRASAAMAANEQQAEEPPVSESRPETAAEDTSEMTQVKLAHDGVILGASGEHAVNFVAGRAFVDRVHLADRIAFLAEMANISGKRGARAELKARLDLGRPGEPQSFQLMHIELTGDEGASLLAFRKPHDQPAVPDPDPGIEKRFLATVSHELRTPLNSIIGFSDILRRDLFEPLANDRQREYVNLIHSSGVHLLSVVNTILDVSKLNAGTYPIYREPFDLNAMIRECVSMLRPQADAKQVIVKAELSGDVDHADADRRAMKQIVINLLSNAVKFTDEGGHIRIRAKSVSGAIQISIEDSGCGIPANALKRLGRPFEQVQNQLTKNHSGSGLGLAIAKSLTELHGGSLKIRSKPNKGTIVAVRIPTHAEDADAAAAAPQTASNEKKEPPEAAPA